jgi:hypothetical protein
MRAHFGADTVTVERECGRDERVFLRRRRTAQEGSQRLGVRRF